MKFIAVTQRVINIVDYGERRDAIDQKWIELLSACDLTPILLPNNINIVKDIFNNINISGIILTGGNSLVKYGGDAPERDETEKFCLEYAIEEQIPLLGVCRGMQVIQDYYGVELKKVKDHVQKKQTININRHKEEVNSYHNWGTEYTVEELEVNAYSDDGIIKGVKNIKYTIQGIMWHPERIYPFAQRDIDFISEFF